MKKIIVLLTLLITAQFLMGVVFLRVGMSSTTGMLGLEYKSNNISLGGGFIPKGDNVSIGLGTSYYFSNDNSFYLNGSYMINATVVDANDDSKGWEDFYGFTFGYRQCLSNHFNIRVGLGLGNSTVTNETGLNIDATLGYRF